MPTWRTANRLLTDLTVGETRYCYDRMVASERSEQIARALDLTLTFDDGTGHRWNESLVRRHKRSFGNALAETED